MAGLEPVCHPSAGGAKGGLGRFAALRVLAGSQGPSAVGALPFSLIPALSLLMARL